MQLISITNDLFDVSSRLRSINDGYRVFYNPETAKYEVHNVNQHPSTLAFVVPFEHLDCRTLEHARYTAVSNAERLFAEMERANCNVARADESRTVNNAIKTITEGSYDN